MYILFILYYNIILNMNIRARCALMGGRTISHLIALALHIHCLARLHIHEHGINRYIPAAPTSYRQSIIFNHQVTRTDTAYSVMNDSSRHYNPCLNQKRVGTVVAEL